MSGVQRNTREVLNPRAGRRDLESRHGMRNVLGLVVLEGKRKREMDAEGLSSSLRAWGWLVYRL
ncbi:hypothetical protein BT67DRAFT_85667 [Trichocladium antarcticum]|uniref:Uncharacterized protein n=1 Tax=Trichocladium antarcticum TaxID=1450529 RepID=A0AAN6UGI7_9PEZI|nr:hypothetical protein BT67DRAFT_85667 [Trichocladium antarcticum]